MPAYLLVIFEIEDSYFQANKVDPGLEIYLTELAAKGLSSKCEPVYSVLYGAPKGDIPVGTEPLSSAVIP